MTEEVKQNNQIQNKPLTKTNFDIGKKKNPNNRGFINKNRNREEERQEEFEQKVVDIARVTRVMAGGKRMRFRACIAIGNKKGRVAIGLAKGADVTTAVTKAVNKAKKNFIDVQIINDTIAHEVRQKYGAAKILLKPAKIGRGIIAGGAVRIVLELVGIKNITSKILGTNNKINNVKCTILALQNLQHVKSKKNPKPEVNNQ
ncbi:MAG: 30S ribosomal protein S5 [Patescibacteria group bacterium]|nr:30S ribosomal protein S5 [Patescibacteria group bacterium]MBU1871041.1 30S ribosomal protein S5 [Patescibacteria group bacterium]